LQNTTSPRSLLTM